MNPVRDNNVLRQLQESIGQGITLCPYTHAFSCDGVWISIHLDDLPALEILLKDTFNKTARAARQCEENRGRGW